jgi:hypothetical protein
MKALSKLAADLEQRARTGAVVSYNELAREYGQPRVTPENWHRHPFFIPFGLMDDEDLSKGLPLRTALVYSKVLNRPGHGFFLTLQKSSGIAISESSQADEWIVELDRLRKHYGSS